MATPDQYFNRHRAMVRQPVVAFLVAAELRPSDVEPFIGLVQDLVAHDVLLRVPLSVLAAGTHRGPAPHAVYPLHEIADAWMAALAGALGGRCFSRRHSRCEPIPKRWWLIPGRERSPAVFAEGSLLTWSIVVLVRRFQRRGQPPSRPCASAAGESVVGVAGVPVMRRPRRDGHRGRCCQQTSRRDRRVADRRRSTPATSSRWPFRPGLRGRGSCLLRWHQVGGRAWGGDLKRVTVAGPSYRWSLVIRSSRVRLRHRPGRTAGR